jgi:hypothetical protein
MLLISTWISSDAISKSIKGKLSQIFSNYDRLNCAFPPKLFVSNEKSKAIKKDQASPFEKKINLQLLMWAAEQVVKFNINKLYILGYMIFLPLKPERFLKI